MAILGRGIRQTEKGVWVPTGDLEMYGENFAPIAKQQSSDDAQPNCFVGGGTLNLLAGAALCQTHQKTLKTVVCAFGGRSSYLVNVDGPSESEVMSDTLRKLMPEATTHPELVVWQRGCRAEGDKTNTYQELINVFSLAVKRGDKEVGIVTVFVHYARVLLMASQCLRNPPFDRLKLQCFVSEKILLRNDPSSYQSRVRILHSSRAFMRTVFFEQRGINCLLAGNY